MGGSAPKVKADWQHGMIRRKDEAMQSRVGKAEAFVRRCSGVLALKGGAVFLLLVASALGRADDPAAPVREAYRIEKDSLAHVGGKASPPWFSPHLDRLFSRRLAGLWERDQREAQATHEIGGIDFDPFIGAQNYHDDVLDDLVIEVAKQRGNRAEVLAHFTNFGPATVHFVVVRASGRWAIDDIQGAAERGGWSVAAGLGGERGQLPSDVILGVVNWTTAPAPQVRVAFRTGANGWEPFPDPEQGSPRGAAGLPRSAHWTICFDGKRRGSLDTELATDEANGMAGVHVQVPASFPGGRSESGKALPTATHALMAVSSADLCADPDGWHRRSLTPAARNALFRAMRENVKVETCDEKGKWSPWRYPDSQIDVVRSYASRRGEWLAMLRVLETDHPRAAACEGIVPEEWSIQLFQLDVAGKARHLGTSLSVVDAGDYDGDGSSELLTAFQRDNFDGYTLFYDGFDKQVSFGWSYH